eukprot:SAG22_NODE_17265_length_308_cov_0.961722_1_plen_102_part_11
MRAAGLINDAELTEMMKVITPKSAKPVDPGFNMLLDWPTEEEAEAARIDNAEREVIEKQRALEEVAARQVAAEEEARREAEKEKEVAAAQAAAAAAEAERQT